jgi:hypothetical protein
VRRTPRDGSASGWIAQAELLKLQKSGQFADAPAKIEGAQIHKINAHVLAISGIKEIALEGRLL